MRFSVVIPTMRRERILEATLDSLRDCDPAPDEVIVIDADAEQSSRPVVTAFDQQVAPEVRYHSTEPSLTRQRNLGIDDASGDVVVFLDDDELARELQESKADVEKITGRPCRTLAYPYGLYDDRVTEAAAAAGYELAFAWLPGPWRPLAAPRLPAPPRHGALRLALKLAGVRRPG